MSDMAELFNDWSKEKQAKRASNRQSSGDALIAAGIGYTSNNGGAHLIVTLPDHVIDFWPGTGLWIVRGDTAKRRGVFKLIAFAKGHQ